MAAVARQAVSVTTAATRLDADPVSTWFTPNATTALVIAQASGTLVLGGSAQLTAATGCRVPVLAGTTISVPLKANEQLWAIVASSTLSVDVLLTGA